MGTACMKKGNNMERAREVFSQHGHKGRDACIAAMVKAGLKQSTASTYFSSLNASTDKVHAPAIVVPQAKVETEAEIRIRLAERFDAMETMAEATFLGMNKSLIISAPAGLGKSFGVMKKAAEAEKLGRKITHIKGNVKATGLYRTLYENQFPLESVVFDDADAIFNDDVSLGLLKAACDSTESRYLNWLTEIKMTDDDGAFLPRRFEYQGSIVFITNIDFDALIARGNRLAPHLVAMMSRSMYLDLTLKTPLDYLVRIKQVLFDYGMMDAQHLTKAQAVELMKFIEDNLTNLRELSLRMVIKLATLMRNDPCHWQKFAKVTCFATPQ